MDGLFSAFQNLGGGKMRYDDDVIDRWNHMYTGIILVIFSILVSSKQYVGSAIICWPLGYAEGHDEYINNYCWISNTYWLPLNWQIPEKIPEREQKELTYYQWVPFFLLIQALLFYIPCMIWRAIADTSAINVKDIIDVAITTTTGSQEDRENTVDYLAKHIDKCLSRQREMKEGNLVMKVRKALMCFVSCGRRQGNFLTIIYFLIKFIYLVNVVGQLFLLNEFLQTVYFFYGVDLLFDLSKGHYWRESGKFPRVTMCDFEIRVLGNLHRHTVQCVLPINMFNEKIFIFLWFIFFFVAIATICSTLMWISYFVGFRRERFIKKYLKLWNVISKERDKQLFYKFVNVYLRTDGYFCLRLIYKNTGELIVGEIIRSLWKNYKTLQEGADRFRGLLDTPKGGPQTNLYPSDDLKKPMLSPDNEDKTT